MKERLELINNILEKRSKIFEQLKENSISYAFSDIEKNLYLGFFNSDIIDVVQYTKKQVDEKAGKGAIYKLMDISLLTKIDTYYESLMKSTSYDVTRTYFYDQCLEKAQNLRKAFLKENKKDPSKILLKNIDSTILPINVNDGPSKYSLIGKKNGKGTYAPIYHRMTLKEIDELTSRFKSQDELLAYLQKNTGISYNTDEVLIGYNLKGEEPEQLDLAGNVVKSEEKVTYKILAPFYNNNGKDMEFLQELLKEHKSDSRFLRIYALSFTKDDKFQTASKTAQHLIEISKMIDSEGYSDKFDKPIAKDINYLNKKYITTYRNKRDLFCTIKNYEYDKEKINIKR